MTLEQFKESVKIVASIVGEDRVGVPTVVSKPDVIDMITQTGVSKTEARKLLDATKIEENVMFIGKTKAYKITPETLEVKVEEVVKQKDGLA